MGWQYPMDQWATYATNLGTVEDKAARFVETQLGKWFDRYWGKATVKDARIFAINLVRMAYDYYGPAASLLAVQELVAVLGAEGVDTSAFDLLEKVDPSDAEYIKDEVDKIVRYQAGKLKRDDVAGFVTQVTKAARQLTHRAANRTVLKNGLINEGQTRFARILTGLDNCTFCVMLASRGFEYASEQSASLFGHNHRNCDCIVVAGPKDADSIEGFDHQELYDLWRDLEELDADESLTSEQKKARRIDMTDRVHPGKSLAASYAAISVSDMTKAEKRRALADLKR